MVRVKTSVRQFEAMESLLLGCMSTFYCISDENSVGAFIAFYFLTFEIEGLAMFEMLDVFQMFTELDMKL